MVLRFCSIIADVQCAAECIMHVYYYALRTNEGEKTNAEYKLGSHFQILCLKERLYKECIQSSMSTDAYGCFAVVSHTAMENSGGALKKWSLNKHLCIFTSHI